MKLLLTLAVAFLLFASCNNGNKKIETEGKNDADNIDASEPTEDIELADTAEPTDTFEPQDTIEPTDTAEPTDTNEPTDTAEPTDTNEPTDTDLVPNDVEQQDSVLPDDDLLVDCNEHDTRSVSCGLNGQGDQPQKCEAGQWVNAGACIDPDECIDSDTRNIQCGFNNNGTQQQVCSAGQWENDGLCDDADMCANTSTRTLTDICGFNGNGDQSQKCEAGQWVNDGGCEDPDECANTDNRSVPCGLNGRGEKPQVCSAGAWIDDGDCVDSDICVEDAKRTVEEAVCLDTTGDQREICITGQWTADGLCQIRSVMITPATGRYYQKSVPITITTTTTGTMIRYTLDGSDPTTTTGTVYTGPLTIVDAGHHTLKARAFRMGMADSDMATGEYRVIRIPCTGQTRCYNNSADISCPGKSSDFFGQDTQYALGYCMPHSYTVSGTAPQDIVTDNNTRLQWQRTLSGISYTWQDAINYCDGLTYGGYSDWRLPNDRELESIVDYGWYSPAINDTAFPATPPDKFWSSSNYVGIDFTDGDSWVLETIFVIPARCVRGDTLPASAFTEAMVSGKVIVTDTVTGLQWTKEYGSRLEWQESLSYCENLDYGGKTDWRLPNINELKTLVNRETHYPSSYFPEMPLVEFWSSSSYVNIPSYAWYFDFHSGNTVVDLKSDSVYARCVR